MTHLYALLQDYLYEPVASLAEAGDYMAGMPFYLLLTVFVITDIILSCKVAFPSFGTNVFYFSNLVVSPIDRLLDFVYYVVEKPFDVLYGSGNRFNPDDLEVVAYGHTTRKKTWRTRREKRETFVSRDGNRALTIRTVRHMMKHPMDYQLALHGFTSYDEERFSFPVHCDADTFARVLSTFSEIEKAYLRVGIVKETALDKFVHFYPVSLGDIARVISHIPLSPQVYGSVGSSVGALVGVSLGLFSFSEFFACRIVMNCVLFSGVVPHSLAYALAEETLNEMFGGVHTLLVETWQKATLSWTHVIVNFIVHYLLWCVPFIPRVFLHNLWNRYAMYYCCSIVDDKVKLFQDVCGFIDVVRKIQQRDFLGFGLSIGANFERLASFVGLDLEDENVVAKIFDYLDDKKVAVGALFTGVAACSQSEKKSCPRGCHLGPFVEDCSYCQEVEHMRVGRTCTCDCIGFATCDCLCHIVDSDDEEKSDEPMVIPRDLLFPNESPGSVSRVSDVARRRKLKFHFEAKPYGFRGSEENFLNWWIPLKIRKSPTFSKIGAFVILLASSRFVSDTDFFHKYVSPKINWESVTESGSLVTTVVSALHAFWKGCSRAVDTGDIKAFFEMPGDARFIVQASELLMSIASTKSEAEIFLDLAQARNLIDDRLYKTNTVQISRLVEKLESYIVSKKQFLENTKCREQPMAILLEGPPGTGKTQLISTLIDVLAVEDEAPRFPGDIIVYNASDKYAVATGAHVGARYLVMNDIPDNYVEYQKNDMVPMNVIWQQIFDTFPLSFRQPDISDKGKVYNNIKYVFISLNSKTLVFPDDASKLVRRFDGGVLVNVEVRRNFTGKTLTFKEFSQMNQGARNDSWAFSECTVEAKNKHLAFESTNITHRFPAFVALVKAKAAAWKTYQLNRVAAFNDPANRCPCGIPAILHETALYEEKTTGQCLSDKCENFLLERFERVLPYKPARSAVGKIVARDVLVGTSSFMDCGTLYSWFMLAFIVSMTYKLFDATLIGKAIEKKAYDAVVKKLKNFLLDHPILWNWMELVDDPWSAKTVVALKFYKYVRDLRVLVDKYKYWVAGLSAIIGGLVAAGAYSKFSAKKEDEPLGNPITVDKVDLKSMNVINFRKEMNFPETQLRSWNKQAAQIYMVELQKSGVSSGDLERMARSNTFEANMYMTIKGKRMMSPTVIFFINQQLACVNRHYVIDPDTDEFTSDRYVIEIDGVEMSLMTTDFLDDPRCEMLVFRHFFNFPVQALQKFFPVKEVQISLKTKPLYPPSWGRPDVWLNSRVRDFALTKGRKYLGLAWPEEGKIGLCGVPVIGQVDGGCMLLGCLSFGGEISGFFSGTSHLTGATLFSKEWYQSILDKGKFPVANDVVVTTLYGNEMIGPLDINSELRNVPSPHLMVVGSLLNAGSSKFKSQLRPTEIYEDVAPMLSKKYWFPTKLRVVKDGVHMSAFMHTFANVNLKCDITLTEMNYSVSHYVHQVTTSSHTKDLRLSPLTPAETVFGCTEADVDRMNFNTSMGSRLRTVGMKNKNDMFVLGTDGLYYLKPIVSDMLVDLHSRLSAGILEYAEMDAVPKDEVRPEEKLEEAKVRIFYVLCFVYNYWGRMMMMPLIQVLLKFSEVSECYGGINAGSADWNKLGKLLFKQGSVTFDVDFEKYDASHGPQSFEMFARTMYWLAIAFYRDETIAGWIYFFCLMFRWQIVRWMKDIFLKFKGMPSGLIFTLIMNSVVNSLLLRIAYLRIFGELMSFSKNVTLGDVGDDDVVRVSDEISSKFNMLTLIEIYRNMGYVATPALKSGVPKPFLSQDEVSFLKRKFRDTEEFGFMAPIDTDSIFKALAFYSSECGISSVERLRAVASSMQREAFLHGKPYFYKFKSWMMFVFDKHSMPMFDLLDYGKLEDEYRHKLFRSFMLGNEYKKVDEVKVMYPLGNRPRPSPKTINYVGHVLSHAVDHGVSLKAHYPYADCLDEKLLIDIFRAVPWGECFHISDPACSLTGLHDHVKAVTDFNDNANSQLAAGSKAGANANIVDTEVQVEDATLSRIQAPISRDDFRSFTTHPLLLYHVIATAATTTAVITTDVVRKWVTDLGSDPLGKKIANFSYFRGDIVLRVVVQGQPFAAGQLVLCAIPNLNDPLQATTNRGKIPSLMTSKIVPHVIVDPSKTSTYELRLPPVTTTGQYSLKGDNYGSYELRLVVYNSLISGTAVTPSVSVCVYMHIENVEFEAMTLYSNAFVEEKKEGGTLSTFVKNVGKYSPLAAVPFPQFAPQITLFSSVASGVGDILARLGFAKPPSVENYTMPLVRFNDNYSQFDGKSSAIVLAGSQKTSLGISGKMAGSTESDMLIANIARKRGLVRQFTITPAMAFGQNVAGIYPAPNNSLEDTLTTIAITPLGGVSAPFRYWAGDILVEFEIVASVFHRATLLFAWDPYYAGGAVPPMELALQTLKNTTIMISGNAAVRLRIPWKRNVPWLALGTLEKNDFVDYGGSNGIIWVYVVNPVVSNGSTDGIYVNAYVSSDNIVFGMPDARRISIMEFEQETVAFTPYSNSFIDVEEIDMGGRSDLSYHTLRSFGEQYESIKHLSSKVSISSITTSTQTGTPDYYSLTIWLPNNPMPVYRGLTYTNTERFNTYQDWYATAYRGYRGGSRWAFHTRVAGSGSLILPHTVAAHSWDITQLPYEVTLTALPEMSGIWKSYAVTVGNRDVTPNLDVVTNMTIPLDFCVPRAVNTAYVDKVMFMTKTSDTTVTAGMAFSIHVMRGSADDATFVDFIGWPVLYL
jgi:DNA polymerase III delta prime subunit